MQRDGCGCEGAEMRRGRVSRQTPARALLAFVRVLLASVVKTRSLPAQGPFEMQTA